MFKTDQTILVLAHKYIGAQEIMQRIRFAYEACPTWLKAGAVDYNKGSITFENGSRILSQTTTANSGRGLSISLLYLDEFSHVPNNIAKDFWTSISPTLSTGGRVIVTSTPNSDEDQFAELWKGALNCIDDYGNPTVLGKNGFKALKIIWDRHPDRDAAWAAKQRADLGDEMFLREHCGEFVIADETLINGLTLRDLKGIDPVERQGTVRWYDKPKQGTLYLVALDPSLGTGYDPAAIQVFEGPELTQIAEWQHNKTPIQQQVGIMAEITKYLVEASGDPNNIYYTVENNTIGEAALDAIQNRGEESIPGIFLSEPGKLGAGKRYRKGINTTHGKKISACSKLKNLVENGRIKIKSKNLVSELKAFVAVGVTFKAKAGETDDLVLAALSIVRMADILKNYHTGLFEAMMERETENYVPLPFVVG